MQRQLRVLLEPLPDADLRRQVHPDLSPLGWHLGHCVFVEAFWIRLRALGDGRLPAELQALYLPELSPKPSRGARLPAKAALLDWAERQQRVHRALLAELPATATDPLRARGYLTRFLLQHHAQHLETMRMVLAGRAAANAPAAAGSDMAQRRPERTTVRLAAGEYTIGSADGTCYDNERPPRRVRLETVHLAARPVRNDEYLAFMTDGGYRDRRWWSAAGWRWRSEAGVEHPAGWRRDARGGWLLLTPDGAVPLRAEATLLGINRFEAEAYAAWAGGRLPHEYEWEAAAAHGLLAGIGGAWEWCGNRFHPYPGFRAFPYDGYSLPWFDGRHDVLRGASPYTHPCIRRPSFRNFYTPDKRHVFAGCRVAYDG